MIQGNRAHDLLNSRSEYQTRREKIWKGGEKKTKMRKGEKTTRRIETEERGEQR